MPHYAPVKNAALKMRTLIFSYLTQLVQLHLEMDMYYDGGQKTIVKLNLPNLKILEDGKCYVGISELHLTAPKLEMLKCHQFESIRFSHSNTIPR